MTYCLFSFFEKMMKQMLKKMSNYSWKTFLQTNAQYLIKISWILHELIYFSLWEEKIHYLFFSSQEVLIPSVLLVDEKLYFLLFLMKISKPYDCREKIKSLQQRFNNCKSNKPHEPHISFKIPWCLRAIIWILATGTRLFCAWGW